MIDRIRRSTKRAASGAIVATLLCVGYTIAPRRAAAQLPQPAAAAPPAPAATPASTAAGDHVVLFAGGQIDTANVGYLGGVFALPGSIVGRGFALGGSGFFGDYGYDGSALGTVRAHFTGGEFDAIYQISSPRSWNDFELGLRDANTSLEPYDPTNRRRGNILEFAPSANGGAVSGPYRIGYYASYGTKLADYAARGNLTHSLDLSTRLGLELSFEGDPTYALHAIGPFAGFRMGPRSELQLSTGVSQQTSRSPSGFLRASIYRSF